MYIFYTHFVSYIFLLTLANIKDLKLIKKKLIIIQYIQCSIKCIK